MACASDNDALRISIIWFKGDVVRSNYRPHCIVGLNHILTAHSNAIS
jgi:hypothetical protein